MSWIKKSSIVIAVLIAPITIGCHMGVMTPIPMQPWMGDQIEQKYANKNDFRTPVMPPIRDGFPPPLCEDPPAEREVLRTMTRVTRGVPFVYEEFRDDLRIVSERIVDRIDPPRFFPLVGMAQLHHCHWKCTIYYTSTKQSDYPFAVMLKRRRVEVIYIDKDHLHQYVGSDPEIQRKITREHTDY